MALYKPRTWTETLFALLVVFEAVLSSAINGRLTFLITHNTDKNTLNGQRYTSGFTTVLSLTLFGFLYMILLTYDSLAQRNLFQACGLCIYNCWMIVYFVLLITTTEQVYSPMDQGQITRESLALLISNISVVAVCTFFQLILTYGLYRDWRWAIFRLLDAKRDLQSLYRNYQIFATLLKFDFLFFVGATMQLIIVVRGRDTLELSITILATACFLPLLLAISTFTAKENLYACWICIVILIAYQGFFIWRIIRLYNVEYMQPYVFIRSFLTFWLAVTMIYAAATTVMMLWNMKNFGGGLKRYLDISRDAPPMGQQTQNVRSQAKYRVLTDNEHLKPGTSSVPEIYEMHSMSSEAHMGDTSH